MYLFMHLNLEINKVVGSLKSKTKTNLLCHSINKELKFYNQIIKCMSLTEHVNSIYIFKKILFLLPSRQKMFLRIF